MQRLRTIIVAVVVALTAALVFATPVFAQWPTTCVDLNDIVEAHLGRDNNVGIYQRVFGDQAEAGCQGDHREDVRGVFAWAFDLEPSGSAAAPPPAEIDAPAAEAELGWPTTCVDLNDIVENHLGNDNNVGIYQRVFGDQAEAGCRGDHREDVRGVFAWAFDSVTPTRAQSASDRSVLVALYHSTGGAIWDANTNWLSDRPIGEWHGVTTDSDGRVVRVFLHGNRLTGEIPPELGRLSNLNQLALFGNQLTGEIPPELGRLSNLTRLDLGDNQLTGAIPPELGRLSNLSHLALYWNPLTGCIPEGLREVAENDLVRLNLSDCGAATLTPTVTSLGVAAIQPLTSIGEKVQLSVTANMPDGSTKALENGLVEWWSSDPWVVSVSQGVVAAVGGGNATIAAAYEGAKGEAPISVRISTMSTGTVRVLYAVPSDREFRPDYSETIANFIVDLQSWYRRELSGLTFSLYEATPEVCRMSEPEDYYVRGNAWANIVEGVQRCAPVQHDSPDFVWVVYADVEEPCDEPQELGAGGPGLTILPDVRSGFSQELYYHCGEGPWSRSTGSWTGGLGHELGHALGLPHPPGCDPWDPKTCDDVETRSLMHDGYESYPDTYLLPDDKEILIRSPFIG